MHLLQVGLVVSGLRPHGSPNLVMDLAKQGGLPAGKLGKEAQVQESWEEWDISKQKWEDGSVGAGRGGQDHLRKTKSVRCGELSRGYRRETGKNS